ncbi:MAG: hypothetical protein WKF47_09270 [Geodermatophilaceae bacterium]
MDRPSQQRYREQRQQREHCVQGQHHGDHPEHQQQAGQQVQDLHEHVLRVADVAGHPGGEVTHALSPVVAQGLPVQPRQHRDPKVVGDLQPGRGQQPGGPVAGDAAEHDERDQRGHRQRDPQPRVVRPSSRRGGEDVVDHPLQRPRERQAQGHADEGQRSRVFYGLKALRSVLDEMEVTL